MSKQLKPIHSTSQYEVTNISPASNSFLVFDVAGWLLYNIFNFTVTRLKHSKCCCVFSLVELINTLYCLENNPAVMRMSQSDTSLLHEADLLPFF